MKVILTERVPTLGNVGEIVNVSPGYARNFLVPKKFALVADESNTKQIEHQNKVLANKVKEAKDGAEALKGKLDGLMIELVKKVGANGKLFGSVTNSDISQELEKMGHTVERRSITIETPIKSVGTFGVKAKLFQDVFAEVQVKVAMDPAQAEELKAKQAAAEKRAAERKKKADAGELDEGAEAQSDEPKAEMTEEEKLKEEANRILR